LLSVSPAPASAGPAPLKRAPYGVGPFRQPEIEDFHRAVALDLDVRGLEIAMDDRMLVRGLKCVGDLPRDRQILLHEGPWAAAISAGVSRATHEFIQETR